MTTTAPAPAAALAARRLPPEVVRELARPRTAADRLRARATTAAAAGIGTVLLVATSVASIRGSSSSSWDLPSATVHGLSPYLADAGLRPGAVLASLLLVLPFLALAVQALRVGSDAQRRRAALVALAGATPADLQRIQVLRTRSAFLKGALWAAPSYAVLWLALGLALPAGSRLLPMPQLWLPLAWVAVVLLLLTAGGRLGTQSRVPAHDDDGIVAVLSRSAPQPPRVPARQWAWVSGAVAAACIGSALFIPGHTLPPVINVIVIGLGVVAGAVCAVVVLARRAARGRNPRPRGPADAAVSVLAQAQLKAAPVAVGAVGAVLFVCGASFGVEAALGSVLVGPGSPYGSGGVTFLLAGLTPLLALAGAGILVTLTALALETVDRLTVARRSVAATAALGLEPPRLLAVQRRALVAASVPGAVAGTLTGGVVYTLLLVVVGYSTAWLVVLTAAGAVLVTAALAGGLVVLACRLVVALLAGRVRAASAIARGDVVVDSTPARAWSPGPRLVLHRLQQMAERAGRQWTDTADRSV